MTRVMLQLVSRQTIALGSDSRDRTQGTKVTAAVAYVHTRKARPEPIAGTTDFKVLMGMGEVGAEAGAPGGEGWRELMQPSFKCLWSQDFEEKETPHFPHDDSISTKFAFTSSKPLFK